MQQLCTVQGPPPPPPARPAWRRASAAVLPLPWLPLVRRPGCGRQPCDPWATASRRGCMPRCSACGGARSERRAMEGLQQQSPLGLLEPLTTQPASQPPLSARTRRCGSRCTCWRRRPRPSRAALARHAGAAQAGAGACGCRASFSQGPCLGALCKRSPAGSSVLPGMGNTDAGSQGVHGMPELHAICTVDAIAPDHRLALLWARAGRCRCWRRAAQRRLADG